VKRFSASNEMDRTDTMKPRPHRITALAVVAAIAFAVGRTSVPNAANAATNAGHGSVVEHDSLVAVKQPGTHGGGGQTTGYSFFAKVRDLPLVFRKRALHPGSGIGHHEQHEDEVYYVLSGQGELTLDGERRIVGPGTAVLTRTGSSHALKQLGSEDLVIIIAYPSAALRRSDSTTKR
jgi:mannose-6-phosphate isomerase-like protein (cupin superfamily)